MCSLILRPQFLVLALFTILLTTLPLAAEIKLGTFENPKDQTNDKIEGWYFSNGGEYKGAQGGMKLDDMTSHQGDGSLALNADFSGGGKYVAVRKKLDLSKSEKPEKITFFIKNTNLSYILVRVLDETGQTFQHRINIKQAVDWQKIEMTEMVTKPNWGGAKDGKWHGLIYEFGILIEKQAVTEGNEAQLFIDDVYINGQAPATDNTSASAQSDVKKKSDQHAVNHTPSKLPIPLGQFEDGTVNGWWVHRDGKGVDPSATTDNPHAGRYAMKVPADFGDRDWMSLVRQIDQPVTARELSFYIRGENLKSLNLSVQTAGGQRYSKRITLDPADTWQAITLTDFPNDNPSLGSKDTQLYDAYLLMKFAVNTSDVMASNKPAAFYLDDVNIGVDAPKGMVNVPGAAFVSQGPLSACLQLSRTIPVYWGKGDKPESVVLTVKNESSKVMNVPVVTLIDHQLRPVSQLIKPGQLQVKPNELLRQTLTFDLPAYGQYAIVTEIGDQRVDASLAWIAQQGKPDPKSPFGVQCHFSHGPWGRHQYMLGSTGTLDMLAKLGVGWVRDDAHARFNGEKMIEPEEGMWTFPSRAREMGMMPMISHFDFLDDGKSPDDPASIARFANRAVQVLDHYGQYVPVYEVWNEPTIQPGWRRTPDAVAYTNLLKATYTAIKKNHPDTFVLGVCSAGTDFGFIETVLKNGGGKYMDGISVHPYHGVCPERSAKRHEAAPTWMGSGDTITFEKRMAAIKYLLDKYGVGDLPIWGTEMGYNNKDVTEEWSQSKWLVRQYLIGMTLPYLTRQFKYNFMDQGYNAPDSTKMTFGMFRANAMPEPNAVVYSTMTRMLNGKKFDSKLDLGDGIFANQYVDRDTQANPVLAIWSVDEGLTLGLRATSSSITAIDLMGNSRVIHPVNDTFTMAVTGEVTFLINPGELSVTKPQLAIDTPSRCTSEDELVATVRFSPGFSAKNIKASAPEGWFDARVDGDRIHFTPSPKLGTGTYILHVTADDMSAAASVQLSNSMYLTTTLTAEGVDVTINNPFPYERSMRVRVAAGDARMQEKPTLVASTSQTFSFAVQSQTDDGWVCQPVRINPQLTDGRRGYIQMTEGSSDTLLAGQTPIYPATSIRIDGDISDWQRYKPCLLDGKHLSAKLSKTMSWEGSSDLSAQFWLGDDGNNMLLGIVITDNQFTQGAPVNLMWQGDSVQFAVASDTTPASRHEFTLGVDQTGKLQVYEQAPLQRVITNQVQSAVKTTGQKRVMELAIPWTMLGVTDSGKTLPRFALLVNDNDAQDADKDNLLRNRKSFLQWFEGIGGSSKQPDLYSHMVRQSR